MKIKIENGLNEQKKQMASIIQKYSSFIEKLMKDKKELSFKLEEQSKKLNEKNKELKILEEKALLIDSEYENDKFKNKENNQNLTKIIELESQNTKYRES